MQGKGEPAESQEKQPPLKSTLVSWNPSASPGARRDSERRDSARGTTREGNQSQPQIYKYCFNYSAGICCVESPLALHSRSPLINITSSR